MPSSSPLCEQKRTLSLACLIDPVPTPMMVFPIGVEHTLDVTVERPHNADARKHCRPIVFRDQDQGFHGCLPLWCLVLGFRKLRDVGPSILQRDEAGDRGGWGLDANLCPGIFLYALPIRPHNPHYVGRESRPTRLLLACSKDAICKLAGWTPPVGTISRNIYSLCYCIP